MEPSKMVLMNPFAGQNRDTGIENRLVGTGWGEARAGQTESSVETYTLPCVK